MNTEKVDTDRSCWTCEYQRIGGDTFLGLCAFPAKNNPKRDKPIPPAFVDTGCRNWKAKADRMTGMEG